MTYVIHGATGAQGGPLLARLLQAGHRAVAATRRPPVAGGLPAVVADHDSVESLVAAYRGAQGVFVHLPVTAEADRLRHARNMASAIAIARPRRVVISTSGWVVDEPGSPMQNPPESAIATLIRETEASGVSTAVVAPRLFLENLLNPLVLEPANVDGVLRYPLRAGYRVAWSSHLDVAEVAERLLMDSAITGVVGVGQSPGLTGDELAAGFATFFQRAVSYEALTPEAFGAMIAPMLGEGPAAGVVAGYRAQALATSNTIASETSAQARLGMVPRTTQRWLADLLT
ncbi:SDR family oxidoreductase [Roseateles sp. DXS20W]|uniref:SDR family oxidoreductase n=1 Tax=Pelomonas lactea TaxID=3299030 RepID=A0ABW7GHR6_9BURK